jgi:hypothetical protein
VQSWQNCIPINSLLSVIKNGRTIQIRKKEKNMDEVFEVEYIEAFPENCYDRFVIGEKFWITLPDFVKENFTTLNLSSDRLLRYLEDYLLINKLPLPWGILTQLRII